MNDIVIQAKNISKKYKIGARQEAYKTLRDTLSDAFSKPFRKAGRLLRGESSAAAGLSETIWALEDVSFEVKRGEIVGIIGRNGAGKSTLLKILSHITEPTGGFAEIHGRVGSLLEVGTGFHAELTGRENIYLNGAILGMKRGEIDRKFDEIVAFSEVDRFIDTPVKHYSSGMYLRLAFAVAAHLEPEVLIVDEVLAVGDASFQKKCINRMEEVGNQGRTVIFVSHNMQAVTQLCERVILLNEGRVFLDGSSHEVISAYLNTGTDIMSVREWPDPATAPGGTVARLCAVRVRTEEGTITDTISILQPVAIEMEYEVLTAGYVLQPHFSVYNHEGLCIFPALDQDPQWRRRARPKGRYVSTVWIPGNFLNDGTFCVKAGLNTLDPVIFQYCFRDAVAFHVIDNYNGASSRGDWQWQLEGVMRPCLKWTTQYQPDARDVTTSIARNEGS